MINSYSAWQCGHLKTVISSLIGDLNSSRSRIWVMVTLLCKRRALPFPTACNPCSLLAIEERLARARCDRSTQCALFRIKSITMSRLRFNSPTEIVLPYIVRFANISASRSCLLLVRTQLQCVPMFNFFHEGIPL